jgi:NAD+-dependent secondary alcohol dehydrogenase Adh1
VIGVGGVGHIALQLLRVLGAGSVIGIDTDERRRALAQELGADEVLADAADVREATNGTGADVVLDFVATDETHAAGLAMLARRGLYSTVGYGGSIATTSVDLVVGETAIAGNLVGSWIDLWEMLQLHAQGKVTLRAETHSLEDVNEVLDALRAGDVTGRAVLVP